MLDNLISLPKAAKLLGMLTPAFRYYVKAGRTPKPISFNNEFFFDKDEIVNWKPERKKRKKNRLLHNA